MARGPSASRGTWLSFQGQPGIGVCTAVLPGAHELARGKGAWVALAWSSVLQGWLAVWVGGDRCVRVGPADGFPKRGCQGRVGRRR